MLSAIIQSELRYNSLLPVIRPHQGPSPELVAAAREWSEDVWEKGCQLGAMPVTSEQLNNGLALMKHPVFICGVHRSGTTLIRDLLDNHPELVVLPSEGTFYTNLEHKILSLSGDKQAAFIGKEWLRRLANPINQPPYWLLGHSSENESVYVNFVRYLLFWWKVIDHIEGTQWPHTIIMLSYAGCIGKLSAKWWVDKTPTNERFINRIWNEMPHAKIIHIIRDPAAVLASRKKVEPSFNLRNVIIAIKTSFSIAYRLSASKDPRYLLLRYEDLCKMPVLQIATVASFINIMPSPALNTPTVAGMPSSSNSSFRSNDKPGEIIKPDIDNHKGMTKFEINLLSASIGKLSYNLGYQPVRVGLLNGYYLNMRYFTWFKLKRLFHRR